MDRDIKNIVRSALSSALRALRSREWQSIASGMNSFCPECLNFVGQGHTETCELSNAIAQAEDALMHINAL